MRATAEDQIRAALELTKQVIGSQRPNSWNDQVSMASIRVCLENALTALETDLYDARERGMAACETTHDGTW